MAPNERIMMISTHGYVAAQAEFGKPDTGGQVVYVLELSKCLARLGYRVDILTRRFEDQPETEDVAERVRVHRFPCGGEEFIRKEDMWEVIPEWVSNVSRHIKEKGLKYAFIDSHYWDAGIAGQLLHESLEIPHIHTPHSIGAWKRDNMDGDPEELEAQYNFSKRIREEKLIYDGCDAVLATTPEQRNYLAESEYDVPMDKIKVVPPGYDDTRFFPISRAHKQALKQELGYEGRLVLALGRMARNKGYDLLIRAMAPVCKRLKDVRLLLAAGSDNSFRSERRATEKLKKLARQLRLGKRVIFEGYIADDVLADTYRVADVFALSSRYEPFGMTAVEAMACGTPTVVTTEGGLWEQVRWGQEALYANPFDTDAFGHAIYTILAYPEVSGQLARFGSQRARASFTWMGIAQRVLRIFEDVNDQA